MSHLDLLKEYEMEDQLRTGLERAALLLVLLRRKGFSIYRKGGNIVVTPGPRLTDVLRQNITKLKPHILALLLTEEARQKKNT